MFFSQIMDYLPMYEFHKCVDRYNGDYRVRFTCMDQYLSMAFAQLIYRESLCDIEACLRSMQNKWYHIKSSVKHHLSGIRALFRSILPLHILNQPHPTVPDFF